MRNSAFSPIHEALRNAFARHGCNFLGVTDLQIRADFERFERWLEAGNHASMDFLVRHRDARGDAGKVLPGARSAIIFGLPYAPASDHETQEPRVAKYARLRDYHIVMRRIGEDVLKEVFAGEDPAVFRVCVDTAPVLERALAVKSGLGFSGKNTCFIAGRDGSFFLLGIILTTAELPVTQPASDAASRQNANSCGTCTRCHVHCPTGALREENGRWILDSRKCLSYWTIEHRGTIPREFWPWLAKYWYGCDICQDVCPYNRTGARLQRQDLLRPVESVRLRDVALMDDKTYSTIFGGTPMTRAKRSGLRRNALIAMHVTGDPDLEGALNQILASSDAEQDETVRQTALDIRRICGQSR
jgi:epoxyqueuosine reductase